MQIAFSSLLALYLIGTANFDLGGNGNWHDQQRIGQIIFLALLWLMWLVIQLRSNTSNTTQEAFPAFPKKVLWGIGSVGLIGLVSAALAPYQGWAMLEWAMFFLLVFSIFFIAHFRIVMGDDFDRILLAILGFACAAQVVSFAASYVAVLAGASLHAADFFRGFSNVRFFGHFQTLTLPFLAVLICQQKSLPRKTAVFALLSAWWLLAFVSGTRGTWLGMLASGLLVGMVGWRYGRAWLGWQLAGAVLGLALYRLLFYMVPFWLGIVNEGQLFHRMQSIAKLNGREVLWMQAWEMIRSHPLLGAGPMQYAGLPNSVGAHPHSAILQFAAEWGVPVALILSALITYGLLCFARSIHGQGRSLGNIPMLQVAMFAALIAVSVQSLVDGILVMPYSQTLLICVTGWTVGVHFASRSALLTQPVSRKNIWRLSAGTVLLLGIVLFTLFPEVLYLEEREDAYLAKTDQIIINQYGNQLSPRFWRHGWIGGKE